LIGEVRRFQYASASSIRALLSERSVQEAKVLPSLENAMADSADSFSICLINFPLLTSQSCIGSVLLPAVAIMLESSE